MNNNNLHWGRRKLTPAGILLSAVIASGAVLGSAAPASVASASVASASVASAPVSVTQKHDHALPAVVRVPGSRLFPEGVAWDPTRRAFLVGSARSATVSIVGLRGETRPLIDRPDLISTFGLTVDSARHRVLVTYGDIGVGERSSPATRFTKTGLLIADLRTGRTLKDVDLGTGAANDVTVAPDGTAYVTDTVGDAVVVVDVHGRVEKRITDARFASDAFGVNGIVWHPGGFLIVGKYDTGQLFRVDRRGRVHEIALRKPLLGADGLALRRDGTLLVSTNGIGGVGSDVVRQLGSKDNWHSAEPIAETPWPDPAPTTIALTPHGAYALSGRIDLLNAGHSEATTFTLRRVFSRTGR